MARGPLGFPRLTNLGPLSSTGDRIGRMVFRGSSIGDFNRDEFQDNTIDGRERVVWILDREKVVEKFDISARFDSISFGKIEDVLIENYRVGERDENRFGVDTGNKSVPIRALEQDGLIKEERRRPVTGGLSRLVGAGRRFSRPATKYEGAEDYGVVMFLDRSRVEADLIEVEYEGEFTKEYPLIAGAVDKGSSMFAIPGDDGRPAYFRDVNDRSENAEGPVIKWALKPLENFLGLEPEAEVAAYTREIDLDKSLFGLCMYVTENELSRRYQRQFDSEPASNREAAKRLRQVSQEALRKNEDRLVVCVKGNDARFGNGNSKVPRRSFVGLWTGQNWITDYTKAVPFTDPDQF